MRVVALVAGGLLATIALVVGAGAVFVLFVPSDVASFESTRAGWQPSEAWLLDRHGREIARQRMDYSFRRFEWSPLDAISPALIAAVVDAEDRRFWEHEGVDWKAVLGAMRDHAVSERRRGASTLTMQLARLMQPQVRAGHSPGAFRRKLAQVRVARSLEASWSKRQILEAYLNLVTFRGELQGVDAASRLLADKAPSGLSLSESAVLAALLPAPNASPEAVTARACARASARRIRVSCTEVRTSVTDMLARSEAVATDEASGGKTPGDTQLVAAPFHQPSTFLAPHLARAMLSRAGERLRTTLDANVQRIANNVLRQHLAALSSQNVRDGAVLVVENETGHVLAYVGSAGTASRSSQVDGVRAARQAGSTLKPFLYALALERRYVEAASLLDDSPISLDTSSGIYLPQNYDRDFKGLVSVRTALGSSLNIPAVRTLVLTGVEPFRDRLVALGYSGITRPGDFYGYALALGAPEVTLWEQVQAYRSLARGGKWSPIAVTHARPEDATFAGEDTRVVSGEAAYVISDILSDRGARALTFGLDSHLNTPFWSAVKTGTSKDMRDNWCIGFSRTFTVGVWAGNFEGDSMHDVSGVTGAAPVWNEIMLALHASMPSEAPEMPDGVTRVRTRFARTIEPARMELFLDAEANATITAVSAGGEIAHIASPANGMVIALDPDIPPAFQRVPVSARGVREGMVLKLNGTMLGPAKGPVLWSPRPGAHVLALEDSAGRTLDRARFIVR